MPRARAYLSLLAAGRVPLVVLAAGILVLSAVFAAVIAGAAFAPSRQAPESAARTLDLLLRAVPGYRPPPCSRWLTVTSGPPQAQADATTGPSPASAPSRPRRSELR